MVQARLLPFSCCWVEFFLFLHPQFARITFFISFSNLIETRKFSAISWWWRLRTFTHWEEKGRQQSSGCEKFAPFFLTWNTKMYQFLLTNIKHHPKNREKCCQKDSESNSIDRTELNLSTTTRYNTNRKWKVQNWIKFPDRLKSKPPEETTTHGRRIDSGLSILDEALYRMWINGLKDGKCTHEMSWIEMWRGLEPAENVCWWKFCWLFLSSAWHTSNLTHFPSQFSFSHTLLLIVRMNFIELKILFPCMSCEYWLWRP